MGLILNLPSPLDEKNGIPISPQKADPALDLDLEKEPESELDLDEPQKPGKPSVFVVFQKVRCRPEGSAKRWLLTIFPSPGLQCLPPNVTGSRWLGGAVGRAVAAGLGLPCPLTPCLRLPDLADGAVPCVGLHSHPVRLSCHHSHGDQLHQPWEVE